MNSIEDWDGQVHHARTPSLAAPTPNNTSTPYFKESYKDMQTPFVDATTPALSAQGGNPLAASGGNKSPFDLSQDGYWNQKSATNGACTSRSRDHSAPMVGTTAITRASRA
ncbi:hypothetical protein A0H81_03100 [Grifola frondosa]|uniref:Uncharacterized protein n=1 Tax=Grifola frondosa TaxID=5627 RepID=A0A1C7MI09_GRIFR|nr:hypothetical protein A0H81_03100 [Grifola frondosa]